MGSHMTKPSNKNMVDRLVERNCYIHSQQVEGVFRAVDRAMYFDIEEGEPVDPYEDDPWRRGNLHLSAPCIYAKVLEALDLRPGLSFLNLGSGTGYLNTLVGLLVGPNGINHGIEFHADVVAYAYNRLQMFKQNSKAIDKYDFVEPTFIRGNCLNLNPNSRYDRVYLGAACLPNMEIFIKKLIKLGGILVMPVENHLMKHTRLSENEWTSEKLMDVNFTLMIGQGGIVGDGTDCDTNKSMIDMPKVQVRTLRELCRIAIRQELRRKTNLTNPNLLNSDNIEQRKKRRLKAHHAYMEREKALEEKRQARRAARFQLCLDCRRHRSAQWSRSPSTKATTAATAATTRPETSAQNRIVTRSASRQITGGTHSTSAGSTSANLGRNAGGTSGGSGTPRNMTSSSGSLNGQSDRVAGVSGSNSDSSQQDVAVDSDQPDMTTGNNTSRPATSTAGPAQIGAPLGGVSCAMLRPSGSPLDVGEAYRADHHYHPDSYPGNRLLGGLRRRRHHHQDSARARRGSRHGPLLARGDLFSPPNHSSDESIGWSEFEELERRLDRGQLDELDWFSPYMRIDMLNNRPVSSSDSSLSDDYGDDDGDDDDRDEDDDEIVVENWNSDDDDEQDNQSDEDQEDDDDDALSATSSTYDVIELSDDGSIRSSVSASNNGGPASDDNYLSATNNESGEEDQQQQQHQQGPVIQVDGHRSPSQSSSGHFDQEPVASRLRSRRKIATTCRPRLPREGDVCAQHSGESRSSSHSLHNCDINRHLHCHRCRVHIINNGQSSDRRQAGQQRAQLAANVNNPARHEQSVNIQPSLLTTTITTSASSGPAASSVASQTGRRPLLSGRFLIATGIGATFSIGTRPSDWSTFGAGPGPTSSSLGGSPRAPALQVAARRRQTPGSPANYRNLMGPAGRGGLRSSSSRSPSSVSSSSMSRPPQSLQQPGCSLLLPPSPSWTLRGPPDRKRKRHSSSSSSSSDSASSASSEVSSSRRRVEKQAGESHHQQHHRRHRRRRHHRRHSHCCHHQDRYSSPGRRRCYRARRPCHPHNHSSGYLCRNHRQQYQHRHQGHGQQEPSRRLGEIAIDGQQPLESPRAGVAAAAAAAPAASGRQHLAAHPTVAARPTVANHRRRLLSAGPSSGKRKRRRPGYLDDQDERQDDEDDDQQPNAGGDLATKNAPKGKRKQNECEKYHSHMRGYISQLPLPRVLLAYLNYERAL